MLLLTINYVPGKEIEALGIAKGTTVQSKNFGKDFMSGMKGLVGGELTSYTEMLNEARQIATKRMVEDAEALGADAVINVRYGFRFSNAGLCGGNRIRHRHKIQIGMQIANTD